MSSAELPSPLRHRAPPSARSQVAHSSQNPNLDLLRSLAIGLVIVDHLLLALGVSTLGRWQVSQIGLFGVYLFFVHTSLVLMWSLERRPNTLDFYIRRAFRIYPLAIAAVLLVAATHAPVGFGHSSFFDSNHHISAKQILINAALANEVIGHQTLILGVTWSLGPEVLMYLLLPCLFFFAHSSRRIWPFVVLWGLIVLYDLHFFGPDRSNIFPTLIPDFLGGIVAYVGFMRRKPFLPAALFVPLLALFFALYMTFSAHRAEWFLTLLLGLLLPSFHQIRNRFLIRASHRIALYSYGVYLLHPFALVIAFFLLHSLSLAARMALFLGLTTAFAVAAYHLLERPLIDLGARIARHLARERSLPSSETLSDLEPAP